MGYEWKRTCGRCGNEWYVTNIDQPRKQAKMAGWATPLVGKKRQAIRAEQALVDASNRQLTDAQRCSNCGSVSYTQEQVAV